MTNRPIQMFVKGTGTNGSTFTNFRGQTHTYDAHQRRVKTVEGAQDKVRYNIFDAAGTLVQVYDATRNIRTDYVSGPNGGLARIKRIAGVDEVSFIDADHLGTGRVGTSWGGAQAWEDWHTPFGESLIHPDETDDQSDYTGHIRDKATGLTYMQARYYDPVIGRFLSEDPVTMLDMDMNPGYFNRYAYTFNDPVNLIDPTGMCGLRKENGDCDVINNSSDAEAGREEVALESQLNVWDKAINGIGDTDTVNIRDSKGNTTDTISGKDLKDAWNNTTWEVVADGSVEWGNGGLGWAEASDSGPGGKITTEGVEEYKNSEGGGTAGLNLFIGHDFGHITQPGRDARRAFLGGSIGTVKEEGVANNVARSIGRSIGQTVPCRWTNGSC